MLGICYAPALVICNSLSLRPARYASHEHCAHAPPLIVTCHLSVCKLPIGRAVSQTAGQAAALLMPVAARRALHDLQNELWTRVSIEFYSDPEDGVFKGLLDLSYSLHPPRTPAGGQDAGRRPEGQRDGHDAA